MTGQETRNKLTDYWKESGVEKSDEFALLTNIIHQEWTGLSVQAHKSLKSLKTQNLRDHMSEAELIQQQPSNSPTHLNTKPTPRVKNDRSVDPRNRSHRQRP